MPTTPYSRPPITEAVIELRTDDGASEADLARVSRKLAKQYPQGIIMEEVEYDLRPNEPEAPPMMRSTGKKQWRHSTAEGENVVLFSTGSISTSRLAPYGSWEDLFGRTQANWQVYRDLAGKRALKRVGVRYINRLDIPGPADTRLDLNEYLNVAVQRPIVLDGLLLESTASVRVELANSAYSAILTVATAPPALIDHAAVLVDLDVYAEVDLPRRDDDMWAKLSEIRELKNRIFESCITDRTRELIA